MSEAPLPSVGSLGPEGWLAALGLRKDEAPVAVIVEGSWWRAQRTQWRTERLLDVRELGVPDVFWGLWHGRPVAYACPYGAARTAEVVHIFAVLGARLAIQLGTCGVLQRGVRPGTVIVPTIASCREGVASLYGALDIARASEDVCAEAARLLAERGHQVRRGPIVTWASLFIEPTDLVTGWRDVGYLGVDMETAATLAVASRFGVPALSMLVAWDELLQGRTFLDPLPRADQDAMDRANADVYEVALSLVELLPG